MSEHEELELESAPSKPLISPALTRSLAALPAQEPLDESARELALLYASLIDDAVASDKYTKALRLVGEAVSSYADDLSPTAGDQLIGAWDRISSALAEHSVSSDLGPKLLAMLTALKMTPAAREEKRGPAKAPEQPAGEVKPIQSTLKLLQGRAGDRSKGA